MTQRTRLMLAAIPAVFFSFIILVGYNIISVAARQYDGPLSLLGYVLTFYGNTFTATVFLAPYPLSASVSF